MHLRKPFNDRINHKHIIEIENNESFKLMKEIAKNEKIKLTINHKFDGKNGYLYVPRDVFENIETKIVDDKLSEIYREKRVKELFGNYVKRN